MMKPIHVTAHSKEVKKGSVFVAFKGEKHDGHAFIAEAIKAGASEVYCEHDPGARITTEERKRCRITVSGDHTRKKLGELASLMMGNPTHRLRMIGVTGTSGKTTTTYLIDHILNATGHASARLGTNGGFFKDHEVETANTTPDPVTLQRWFKEVQDQGATHVVMEVSSHALDQDRAWGIAWDGAVFLNLSSEHMDYHKNLEDYFKAKELLFTEHGKYSRHLGKTFYGLANQDQTWGARLVQNHSGLLPFSVKKQIRNLKNTPTGIEAEVYLNDAWIYLHCPLFGSFQIENVLAALSIVGVLGVDARKACASLAHFKGVPGRMEFIENSKGVFAFVDYAHKPEALEKVLEAVKPSPEKAASGQKLICVFGCGGDRDKTKRPVMGEIATRLSDQVILTSDNPRTEDAVQILKEIEAGIQKQNYMVISDRAQAIQKAVVLANPGDILVVAGKGHETYQILPAKHLPHSISGSRDVADDHRSTLSREPGARTEKRHFDDREEVRKAFALIK